MVKELLGQTKNVRIRDFCDYPVAELLGQTINVRIRDFRDYQVAELLGQMSRRKPWRAFPSIQGVPDEHPRRP